MLSSAGKIFIKKREALRLKAYLDQGKKGKWTIGYGHTGPEVVEGLVWTLAQAEAAFERDAEEHAMGVLKACRVLPNTDQLDALTSLTFNIGVGNFRTSTVLKRHNEGNFAAAGAAFGMWNEITDPETKKKRVSEGLTKRRALEAAVYLTEREEQPHTTCAIPEAKDPATASSFNPANIATGLGSAAATTAATVSTVAGAWDTLNATIDPRILVWGLVIATLGALAYFAYDKYRRNQAGDR